jgi:hypothetical protein
MGDGKVAEKKMPESDKPTGFTEIPWRHLTPSARSVVAFMVALTIMFLVAGFKFDTIFERVYVLKGQQVTAEVDTAKRRDEFQQTLDQQAISALSAACERAQQLHGECQQQLSAGKRK